MNENAEQIEIRLKSATNPFETVNLLNELSGAVRSSEPDRSLKLSEEAIKLAEKNNYSKGQAIGLWNKGVAYRLISEYSAALKNFDESIKILKELGDIKEQGKVLNSAANVYANTGDYDNALKYLEESLRLSQSVNDSEIAASILSNIGVIYQETGDYPASLEHYFKSILAYEELEMQIPEMVLNNIGVVYHQLGDYPTALEYYFKSLDLALQKKNKLDEGFALLNIAVVFGEMKEHEKALQYLTKSLVILQELGNKHGESDVLRNIGVAYQGLEEYEKALEFQFKVLKVREEISDISGKADTLIHIGEIYYETGRLTNAEKYFKDALRLSWETGNRVFESLALLKLGKLSFKQKDYENGFNFLFEGLKYAESRNAQKEMLEIHRALYEGYKLTGDIAKSLKHHEKFYTIEKEISNLEADRKLKSLTIRYQIQTADKERKIALREKEIFRLKNVELADMNKELKHINDEKNLFLGIAAHDLKNPIAGILSLTKKIRNNYDTLKKEGIIDFSIEIEKASEKMLELVTKVLDITAIESGRRNFQFEEFDPAVLAQRVVLDYRQRSEAKQIQIIFLHDEKLKINTDKAALRQILDNLISNAVKFSPFGKNVYVNVKNSDGFIRFEIKDEGPGLTESDKKKLFEKFTRLSAQPTGGENSSGLGLSIAKNLAEALGAGIQCISQPDEGALFVVKFPE
jgi:signal transduction histidine kinase/Tfp pilus assembly protein PilF